MEKYKKTVKKSVWILFFVYLVCLCYLLLFAESTGRTIPQRGYQYNLVPFKEIHRFIYYRDKIGTIGVISNLFGNVVGFMPFGFMLPIMVKRLRNGLRITILSFLTSVVFEVVQLMLQVGSFDVDDIMLNTLGGILGFVVFYIGNCIRRKL